MTGHAQRGFSLLEALVAVAVLAAIAALILPVIRNATAAEARVVSAADAWTQHAAAETAFRDLLMQAQSAPEEASGYALRGEGSYLTFLTRPAGDDALYLATFSIERGRLELSLGPIPDNSGPMHAVVLAEGLTEMRFFYFGERSDGRGLAWSDDWTETYPPRLVVLDMSRNDGHLRRIEALVGGQAPYDCDYDSGNGICLGAG